MPPNTSFSPAMQFSARIHFTGQILLFVLEQHPFETHLQLPLLLVEHSFYPKITPKGIQIDCLPKYISDKETFDQRYWTGKGIKCCYFKAK